MRGRPILENEFVTIFGDRYDRGTSMIAGGTMQVGYTLTCSGVDEDCEWSRRVNGPLTDARPVGKDHAMYDHGIGIKLWPVAVG